VIKIVPIKHYDKTLKRVLFLSITPLLGIQYHIHYIYTYIHTYTYIGCERHAGRVVAILSCQSEVSSFSLSFSDHLLTSSLIRLLTSSLTHLLTYSRTHLLTNSRPHLLTYSLTPLLTYSLTHSLTYSYSYFEYSISVCTIV